MARLDSECVAFEAIAPRGYPHLSAVVEFAGVNHDPWQFAAICTGTGGVFAAGSSLQFCANQLRPLTSSARRALRLIQDEERRRR